MCWGPVSIVTPDYISYCQRADRRPGYSLVEGKLNIFKANADKQSMNKQQRTSVYYRDGKRTQHRSTVTQWVTKTAPKYQTAALMWATASEGNAAVHSPLNVSLCLYVCSPDCVTSRTLSGLLIHEGLTSSFFFKIITAQKEPKYRNIMVR